jgi:hypothetical protein
VTMSGKQIRRLGERLRDSATPGEEDLRLFGDLLLQHDASLATVASALKSLGLEPTTRLKTVGTTIDKLRRESPALNLHTIRDLAGARVVRNMTLTEQYALAERIRVLWPGAVIVDRCAAPSHGYRALHVVARVDGCLVEIQLRTAPQDTWAQLLEALGDTWGRSLRYGGEPDDSEQVVSPQGDGCSRGEAIERCRTWADRLHDTAALVDRATRLDPDGDEYRLIVEEMEAANRAMRESAARLLRAWGSTLEQQLPSVGER